MISRVDPPDSLDDLRAQPATDRSGISLRGDILAVCDESATHARVQTVVRHRGPDRQHRRRTDTAATCCSACARRCPTSPVTLRPRPSQVDVASTTAASRCTSPTTASATGRHAGRALERARQHARPRRVARRCLLDRGSTGSGHGHHMDRAARAARLRNRRDWVARPYLTIMHGAATWQA